MTYNKLTLSLRFIVLQDTSTWCLLVYLIKQIIHFSSQIYPDLRFFQQKGKSGT